MVNSRARREPEPPAPYASTTALGDLESRAKTGPTSSASSQVSTVSSRPWPRLVGRFVRPRGGEAREDGRHRQTLQLAASKTKMPTLTPKMRMRVAGSTAESGMTGGGSDGGEYGGRNGGPHGGPGGGGDGGGIAGDGGNVAFASHGAPRHRLPLQRHGCGWRSNSCTHDASHMAGSSIS